MASSGRASCGGAESGAGSNAGPRRVGRESAGRRVHGRSTQYYHLVTLTQQPLAATQLCKRSQLLAIKANTYLVPTTCQVLS